MEKIDSLENIDNLMDFAFLINKLKYTFRFSETKCKDKDSTAAHTWRLAVLAYTFHRELKLNLDITKALKIALFHDLAELETGDIDYKLVHNGKACLLDKNKAEHKAFNKMLANVSDGLRSEIIDLWIEFEECKSEEARFIKAIDKLEGITNAFERGPDAFDHTDVIITIADKAVQDFPAMMPVLVKLKERLKDRFEKLGIDWNEEYNYGLDSINNDGDLGEGV